MGLRILKPGLLTSIQDLGRYGFQKYGVVVSGAMDSLAHRIANSLVGNSEKEATLEMTMLGPTVEFEETTLLSICGGNLSPTIDGSPVPQWRPVLIKKGSELRFKGCVSGCRGYLAVAGGFALDEKLNSKSTYLRAGIGGYEGRSLREEDVLPLGTPSLQAQLITAKLSAKKTKEPFTSVDWGVATSLRPLETDNPIIRVVKGKEFSRFTKLAQALFFKKNFKITAQSDRMGYRLEGTKLTLSEPLELISEAVAFGTVQVPPEGNLIILMADRQTTGGYPKIAQVASVDLPQLAQAKPGDNLSFKEISLDEAQQLYLDREKEINQLKLSIELMMRLEE